MQKPLSKKLRREERELRGLAWQRELDRELGELDASFGAWKARTIDGFELSERIHRFHDGVNRDLYKFYTHRGGSLQVPAAIANGILQESEVSPELLQALAPTIHFLREGFEHSSEEEE